MARVQMWDRAHEEARRKLGAIVLSDHPDLGFEEIE